MSIGLREKDLAGFSTYMLEKSNEERTHASRMIAYLVDSDEEVELPTVEAPERQWPSVQQLFDAVYELEKGVTASINRLYGIAEQQGHAAPRRCSTGSLPSRCRRRPRPASSASG